MAHSSHAFPGLNSPAVGFDQPFEMLQACHERVQRSLGLLGRIVAHVDAHGHDAQSRSAAADVLRYFDIAGPHHHEDEERHVFPPLAAHPDARVREVVATLQADHVHMHAMWQRLRAVLHAWQGDDPAPAITAADRTLVAEFAAAYERHIALEEAVVYPAAQAVLNAEVQGLMGQEMAARRSQKVR
ncbi:hemerythrin domain-containing protein [Ottowia sp.]|uniref:hemerythrin domain-containing protein n=1 Tax=Ottowia sp. TaxID=1898956 RepID=UPI003A843699